MGILTKNKQATSVVNRAFMPSYLLLLMIWFFIIKSFLKIWRKLLITIIIPASQ